MKSYTASPDFDFDIVFVTFNSEKWLAPNLESFHQTDYDLKKLHLFYYDNHSSDDTVKFLNNYPHKSDFGDFKIISGHRNLGFGRGNNKAAKLGKSKYILFLNADTEILPETFTNLAKTIAKADKKVGAFELRQSPYEHPKYYDPITGFTPWSSGACLVVKREVFEKIGGFDRHLFMYCEDVDLSWAIRSAGYELQYIYNSAIIHHAYATAGEFKVTQYIYGYVNNLYLRCKYGTFKNALKGHVLVLKSILRNRADYALSDAEYKSVSKKIRRAYLRMIFARLCARFYKHTHARKARARGFEPRFHNDLDYCEQKQDPFFVMPDYKTDKLVSVLIRTCGRPEVLREALESVRQQSYSNIEVVVVEDGENLSEAMIKDDFSDLKIKYKATGKRTGRSHAGNLALKMASGDYFNFLDDDDVFYPDHIETLVKTAEQNHYKAVYSSSFETGIFISSLQPYRYDIKYVLQLQHGHYSRLRLCRKNLFPIQSVLFHRSIYEKCGGFDEKMEGLEDWDFWLNIAMHDYFFHYVLHTTSIYRVPGDLSKLEQRASDINDYLRYFQNKWQQREIKFTFMDLYYDDSNKN